MSKKKKPSQPLYSQFLTGKATRDRVPQKVVTFDLAEAELRVADKATMSSKFGLILPPTRP